jgi:rhamnopyranosyl-N-acetylglucosaminyl-diphospho-decaprenol beta-1,3/1,4-galactofuranosyltransferase
MSYPMKILTAIVTFNRCDLLARCIDNVQSQSRPTDALVVINNGSTDGTVAMLAARGVLVINQDNVGSAGGWHRAIQHAIDGGFDAVWLMDDDGFPDVKALACLEQAWVPDVVCASSIVVQEDRPDHFVFPFPVLDKSSLPVIFSWPRKISTVDALRKHAPSGTYPFVHLFNGALVSLKMVRKVGSVNREFFIYGEEVDFYFRIRKTGQVISVLDALHFHPDVSTRPYNTTKVYYYIKNSLILNKSHYNKIWLRHIFMLGLIFYRLLLRNGISFALSLLVGKNSIVFYKAISRGWKGRIGRDFDV